MPVLHSRWRACDLRLGAPPRLGSGTDLLDAVQQSVRSVISELDLSTWFVPLGIGHVDHTLVARSCLQLAREMPERHWVVYEELPYRMTVPLDVRKAHSHVVASGFILQPTAFKSGTDRSQKRAMISCYPSQRKAFPAGIELWPETFHDLTPQIS